MNPSYNPYAPPAPPAPYGYGHGAPMSGMPPVARVEGERVVLRNGMALPPVCLKCGVRQPVEWRKQKFVWSPQWTILLVLVSLLLGAIVALILQKRSEFQLPLCPACNTRWKQWNLLMVFTALAIIGIIPLTVVAGSFVSSDSMPTIVMVGIFGWLIGIVFVAIARTKAIVLPKKIDKFETWLLGVHPEAIRVLVGG